MKPHALIAIVTPLLLTGALAACWPDDDPPAQCDADGVSYEVGDSWSAGDACNTCTCEADGAVSCTDDPCLPPCEDGSQPLCVEYGELACASYACVECAVDDPCPEGSWCRPTEERGTACVPFVGPGASCEGYVLPWWRERCEPDLLCVPREATRDLPGTCAACSYEGEPHQAGESFPASDGCNTCTCGDEGQVLCTEMACAASCHYLGQDYAAGASFPSYDGCNSCGCSDEGMVGCTKMGCTECPDGQPLYNCFVDPCAVSSCDVEGARCVSYYCGGCQALWFDAQGQSVCEG